MKWVDAAYSICPRTGVNVHCGHKTCTDIGPTLGTLEPVTELCFSILAADFAHLAEDVAKATEGGGTVVHFDVMDGVFVPNISIGPPVLNSLRKATTLPIDCHLMIANPDAYIPAFADNGADWVSVQWEACRHLNRTLELIRSHGMKPGVVINPATPVEFLTDVLDIVDHVLVMTVNPGFGGQAFIPSTLKKIERLAQMRQERDLDFRIQVDGGIDHTTVESVVKAGAELLVAGTSVFGRGQAVEDARSLLDLARKAELARKTELATSGR